MPGITKTLQFAEGVETTGPTTTFLQTTEFAVFANDAAYVSNKGSAAEDGDAYYDSTLDVIKIYANGSWQSVYDDSDTNVVLLTATQTLTNKTLTSPTINTPAINDPNLNGGTASNTKRIVLPKDTTTNLDALTDTEALIAYDTTLAKPVFNTGAAWVQVATGGLTSGGVAYRSGSQAISATGYQKVQLNATSFDIGSEFDTTTNYRLDITTTGYYQISSQLFVDSITAGSEHIMAIYVNGALADLTRDVDNVGTRYLVFSKLYSLNATDYVELYTNHTTDSSYNVAATFTFLSWARVG